MTPRCSLAVNPHPLLHRQRSVTSGRVSVGQLAAASVVAGFREAGSRKVHGLWGTRALRETRHRSSPADVKPRCKRLILNAREYHLRHLLHSSLFRFDALQPRPLRLGERNERRHCLLSKRRSGSVFGTPTERNSSSPTRPRSWAIDSSEMATSGTSSRSSRTRAGTPS